jgi:hypothetical protein
MFRHVVMFQWKDDVGEVEVEKALGKLAALPNQIEEIRAFAVGSDAGLREDNHDVVVVADFDDAEAYLRYADHPAHVALVADHLRPLIAHRAAVQHPLH